MSSKTDQVHVILGDWHKAKERNEQLVRVCTDLYNRFKCALISTGQVHVYICHKSFAILISHHQLLSGLL